MSKRSNPEVFMVLRGGHQVPKWLYASVYQRVQAFLPHMLPRHRYMLKTICGNALWDKPMPGLRILAGRCMTSMVVDRLLPLVFADIGGKKTKQYQLH